MKLIVFLLFIVNLGNVPEPGPDGSLFLLFWNVENFFDWRDDEQSDSPSDAEFSSFGVRRWTRRKFHAKCAAVAKTILWTAAVQGRLPDAVGLAEVENRFVLEQLLQTTALRKLDYRIVHFESPDHRGIDVALLYRASRFRLLHAEPLRVRAPAGASGTLRTRDILLVTLSVLPEEGRRLALLVNHHPSKYGGAGTDWRREVALQRLREAADSLQAVGWPHIVAMGDFNDTPDRAAFSRLAPDPARPENGLVSCADSLFRKGEGSIRYDGRWELIDLFFVSESLRDRSEMQLLRVPFLTVRDNAHAGEKPLRTYSGPRYLGGVSDHRPVALRLDFPH